MYMNVSFLKTCYCLWWSIQLLIMGQPLFHGLLYHESDIVINIKIFCRCSTSNSRRVEYSFTNCCTYQFLYEIWNDTYAGTVYHYTLYTFLKCDEDLNKQKIIICTNYHTCLVSCLRNRNIFLAINRMLCHIYMYILYTSHIY